MYWHVKGSVEVLGMIPEFLDSFDPRPAREQFHENYAHGGGWRPFEGFTPEFPSDNPFSWLLHYPGDPPLPAIAYTRFRTETIVMFKYSWIGIFSPTAAPQIARLD